jgi:ribosomal protein L37AE/L43A
MDLQAAGFITALIPFALAMAALLWIVVRVRRRSRDVSDAPALWQRRDYVCPDCGHRMQQGWVLMGKGAIWTERARARPGLFAHIGNALPNTLSMRLPPAANMAWRCDNCRMLLIDHDKLVY